MGKILDIAQLGNPVLRAVAHPITNLQDQQLHELIADLLVTVHHTHGVGIAAPQVSHSQRVFIVASHPNPRYPQAPQMEPTAMINPCILNHSSTTSKGWEGCLSIPGIRGLVPRYDTIEVEYLNLEGEPCRQEFSGFVARIFQHELDHLNGLVFLDRVESTQELVTEQEYHKLTTPQQS